MLTGPIPATEKVLRKAGVGIADIGVFEVNEAFAPVPLAWLAETGADPERLNPLGGAIALGPPARRIGRGADDPHGRITCATTGSVTGCRPCVRAAAPPTPPSWNLSPDRTTGRHKSIC